MRAHPSGVHFGRQEPRKFGAKGGNVKGVGSQKTRSAYPTYRDVGKSGSVSSASHPLSRRQRTTTPLAAARKRPHADQLTRMGGEGAVVSWLHRRWPTVRQKNRGGKKMSSAEHKIKMDDLVIDH